MSKCNTCKYRAAKNALWKCEYITITGHSRGCEPGNLCTVYERGRRIVSSLIDIHDESENNANNIINFISL